MIYCYPWNREGEILDGLERRYKVRLREKYENSIDAQNIQINSSLVAIGLLAGASAIALSFNQLCSWNRSPCLCKYKFISKIHY